MFYFLRSSNSKAITPSNVSNEINFGVLDASNGKLLDAIEKMLASVMLPALSQLDDWGSLKTRNNPHVQYFVESLDQFVSNINNMRNNMSNQVKLVPSDLDPTLANLITASDYQNASLNTDFMIHCEELLGEWCKQIAKVSHLII